MQVKDIFTFIAGPAVSPPDERSFLVALDEDAIYRQHPAGGWLTQRYRRAELWNQNSPVVPHREEGHEYQAIAVTRLDEHDQPREMGIFVWRSNYLCCERCGPNLAQSRSVAVELLRDGGLDTIAWRPFEPNYEFGEAELRAWLEAAVANGCPQADYWCRVGGQHT
jgi:hypothetical protein